MRPSKKNNVPDNQVRGNRAQTVIIKINVYSSTYEHNSHKGSILKHNVRYNTIVYKGVRGNRIK